MKTWNPTTDMQVMTVTLAYFLSNPFKCWDLGLGYHRQLSAWYFVMKRSTELQNLQILPSPNRDEMIEMKFAMYKWWVKRKKGFRLGMELVVEFSSIIHWFSSPVMGDIPASWIFYMWGDSGLWTSITAQRNFPQTLLLPLPSPLITSLCFKGISAHDWRIMGHRITLS